MMTIIKKVEKILLDAGIEEYKAEARLIVEEISGLSREKILVAPAGEKIENEEKIFEIAQKRAKTGAPIQQILGFTYFAGEKYIVSPEVLIPRDETEILVEESAKLLQNSAGKIDILDIGVGSGCISCALAKKLSKFEIEILAVDISTDAIKIALENASRLDLIRKIVFRKSDVFSKIRDFEKFDLIVSNPPYIPLSQKENLQKEVRDFDPPEALFAEDDKGLEFYERIVKDAPKFLKDGGFVAFECGGGQGIAIKEIFERNNFKDIKITKDLAGIDRVITARQ